ncbi:MAG: hypothetical protein M1827_006781 [Pycnora praestabilis]|nr:MAG: hypothetical protein M1827_006781 [Pycnora praestabilis]
MHMHLHLPIRILTHNIRYATTSPFQGEELWSIRRPHVINELRYNTLHCPTAFICLQEVLNAQLLDILAGLNGTPREPSASPSQSVSAAAAEAEVTAEATASTSPQVAQHISNPDDQGDDKAYPLEWEHVGVGRDDGFTAGEYSPILYRPSIYTLLRYKTVWLSLHPERPSKSWDAASTRILTIGVFRHRESGKKVVAMNTHLDDQGSRSRYESAKIILREIEELCGKDTGFGGGEHMPVFLAGDFNSEEGQEAYQVLNDKTSSVSDLRDFIPPKDRYGHENTFTGFGYEMEPAKRIDFLFLGPRHSVAGSKKEGEKDDRGLGNRDDGTVWKTQGYAVLESRFDDGVYNSDHRAVVGDVLLS